MTKITLDNSTSQQTINFPLNYSMSQHEKKILDYLGQENVVNSIKNQGHDNMANVFICFTNRCGSNFFAEVLESTSFFPSSGEFFNWEAIIKNSKQQNLQSLDEFCLFLIRQRQKNNFFISKVGYQQLFMLSKYGQIPNIINNPKFIWIRRRDVISQAVSLVIADQTKKWTSYHSPTEEITPVYKMDSILLSVSNIIQANTMFETYLRMFNAEYLEIIYEDFCSQTLDHMREICSFVQQDFKMPNLKKIKTKVQRNSINKEFKEKFLSDLNKSFTLKC